MSAVYTPATLAAHLGSLFALRLAHEVERLRHDIAQRFGRRTAGCVTVKSIIERVARLDAVDEMRRLSFAVYGA